MAYDLDSIQLHLKIFPDKITGELEKSWYLITSEEPCEQKE